jgi:hypothetical protein
MTVHNFRWTGWSDERAFFTLLIRLGKVWTTPIADTDPSLVAMAHVLTKIDFHTVRAAGKAA